MDYFDVLLTTHPQNKEVWETIKTSNQDELVDIVLSAGRREYVIITVPGGWVILMCENKQTGA